MGIFVTLFLMIGKYFTLDICSDMWFRCVLDFPYRSGMSVNRHSIRILQFNTTHNEIRSVVCHKYPGFVAIVLVEDIIAAERECT